MGRTKINPTPKAVKATETSNSKRYRDKIRRERTERGVVPADAQSD